MASVKELSEHLGKQGIYYFDRSGFGVSVRVRDVRESWGKVQVNIYPNDGTGDKWVDPGSVAFHES